MPANFDLFSTAVMLKAVEQMPRIYRFLADTFAADAGLCDDENAMYDYRKGVETGLAPFVVPGTGGIAINRDGYEMRNIRFSTLAPERVVTLADVSSRLFGEAVTGALTPEQRSKRVIARDLTFLRTMIQNRRDWMVREMLLKGKLQIKRYDRCRGFNPELFDMPIEELRAELLPELDLLMSWEPDVEVADAEATLLDNGQLYIKAILEIDIDE